MNALRAPQEADVPAIVSFMNDVSTTAYGTADTTEAEFRRWLTSPDVDPARDVRLLERDGRIIGYVDMEQKGTAPVRTWCDLQVHPSVDPGDVAPIMLNWVEERAGHGVLRTWVPSVSADLKRAYEELGLELVRHSYRMQIDLEQAPEAPVWPDGIDVRTFRDGDGPAVYEAHEETFEDSWEHVAIPYEEWTHWFLDRDDFDPGLVFLAHDGDELAGVLLSVPMPTEPDAGYVQVLGVRRPWRRRGIGVALLRRSFQEFHDRGFARVTLGVDASSLTGANLLYENAGMRVVRRWDFYERTL